MVNTASGLTLPADHEERCAPGALVCGAGLLFRTPWLPSGGWDQPQQLTIPFGRTTAVTAPPWLVPSAWCAAEAPASAAAAAIAIVIAILMLLLWMLVICIPPFD
jgi:hypothetical protein